MKSWSIRILLLGNLISGKKKKITFIVWLSITEVLWVKWLRQYLYLFLGCGCRDRSPAECQCEFTDCNGPHLVQINSKSFIALAESSVNEWIFLLLTNQEWEGTGTATFSWLVKLKNPEQYFQNNSEVYLLSWLLIEKTTFTGCTSSWVSSSHEQYGSNQATCH